MKLADRLFHVTHDSANRPKDKAAKEEAERLLKDHGVPFASIGWDYYDESLEVHGVEPAWRMSGDARKALAAEGFATVYVNHTDGWETHYSLSNVSRPGWRVSYPNKGRREGEHSAAIWVEARVDGWPAQWFDTGYVVIKGNETTGPAVS